MSLERALLSLALLVGMPGCMKMIPKMTPKVEHEAQLSAAFPYESRSVDVLDSRMHYVEVGEGAPIVLLHGNPTSSYLWRNVIPHLQGPGRRVIAVDLIGMGKSGKPDIDYTLEDHVRYFDAFVEALDLKDVVLVVHDWGGGIGFDHAMRHEENIRGIAFMETIVFPFAWKQFAPPERYLFKRMRSNQGDRLLYEQNYFVEKLLPAFSGRELSDAEMAVYRAPYPDAASRRPTRVWPQEVPFDGKPGRNAERIAATYERLKASDVPLKLLVADPGALMKPEIVEQLQADLPRLEVEPIGPGLHFVQESQPTAVGVATSTWIDGLRAWSGPSPAVAIQ